MTTIPTITYQSIVNVIVNYIKTNCVNIADYANISSVFKSGYSVTTTIPGGNELATCYCTYTISDNSIEQVAGGTVDTDMANFLNTIDVTDKLSSNIKESEFYNFINDMISFVSTKLVWSISQYEPSTEYLIYYPSNTTFNNIVNITNGQDYKICVISDLTSIVNMVVEIAKQNMRVVPCKYTLTYS